MVNQRLYWPVTLRLEHLQSPKWDCTDTCVGGRRAAVSMQLPPCGSTAKCQKGACRHCQTKVNSQEEKLDVEERKVKPEPHQTQGLHKVMAAALFLHCPSQPNCSWPTITWTHPEKGVLGNKFQLSQVGLIQNPTICICLLKPSILHCWNVYVQPKYMEVFPQLYLMGKWRVDDLYVAKSMSRDY